jgi:ElaB/YqjD/DUF883 family membrane-anchored ribosome-binding protein
VDHWLAQREDIADELNAIIGRAQGLLSSLATGAANLRRQAASAVSTAATTARKRRRKVSAAARAQAARRAPGAARKRTAKAKR